MDPMTELALRDIHAAPPPGFWPPAPGWWAAVLVVGIALFLGARVLLRYYRNGRRRRAALDALSEIHRAFGKDGDKGRLAAHLSILLRQIALLRFPREMTAGLTGVDWLNFLDDTGGGGRFSEGPGRALISAPYARQADLEVAAVRVLVEDWVRKNI
jgi:hypothetical protein